LLSKKRKAGQERAYVDALLRDLKGEARSAMPVAREEEREATTHVPQPELAVE
jgi:hypothetical protein